MFQKLREAGIISTCWAPHTSKDQYFYRAELDALLEKLRGNTPTFEKAPARFVALSKVANRKAVDWSILVADILEGRLATYGVLRGLPGISGFLLDPTAVTCQDNARPMNTLTKSAARELLGLNQSAWRAIEGSMLSPTSTVAMTYVDWGQIEEFDHRFISLRRIASIVGITSPKARERLDAFHVKCVISGEGFAIYSRLDAQAVFPVSARWHVSKAGAHS